VSPFLANHGLTPQTSTGASRSAKQRRRDVVENDEYVAFVRRIIRAYARRIASGDVEALRDMVGLAGLLDDAISEAVTGLHKTGYSWEQIADRLGITRQAAYKRWGRGAI
jgi:hypothetical protein